MASEMYFNFPVQLLKGFMIDSSLCLENIRDYALYEHSLRLELGTELVTFLSSAKHYGISFFSENAAIKNYENGVWLYDTYNEGSPHVGIRVNMWYEFLAHDKEDFEKLTLLAYLAFKSILGKKPYCVTNNQMLFSRMDGNVKIVPYNELSDCFQKYVKTKDTQRHWSNKIRDELEDTWNFVFYSQKIRGYYVSTSINPFELGVIAETKKSSYKAKIKAKERQALNKAVKDHVTKSLIAPHQTPP